MKNSQNTHLHKENSSSLSSKALQGKPKTAPLSFSKIHSTKITALRKTENPNLANTNVSRLPTKDGEQVVDFFWRTGRLPTTDEQQNLTNFELHHNATTLDPVQLQENLDLFQKNSRLATQQEPKNAQFTSVDFCSNRQCKDCNFEDAQQQSHDSLESLDFPRRGESKSLDVSRNGRIRAGDEIKIFHSFRRKSGLMPLGKVGNSHPAKNDGGPVVSGFANEQAGGVGSVEENGSFCLADVLDSIQRMPAGVPLNVARLLKEKVSVPTTSRLNSLLKVLLKAGKHEHALSVFGELLAYGVFANGTTFSIMIQCHCKRDDPDEAKRMLDEMSAIGAAPNVITFTVLIDCFCKRGRLQKAFEIFEIMSRMGCEPVVQTYNCLIGGLCFVGRVEEAHSLLMKIRDSSKKPNIYTFTLVMDGFCKVGRSDDGMDLLQDAIKMGLQPTVVSFNTIFSGYSKEGRPLKGISLLKQMEEIGCQPDFIIYSTLLHGLLVWNKSHVALKIYKEMLRIGFKADSRTMNALLLQLCRKSSTDKNLLRDAEELFQSMKQMEYIPTTYAYCSMIQAFSFGGRTDGALSTLLEMLRFGYFPTPTTYNAVIDSLCCDGRANEAWLVLVCMIVQSTMSTVVSYNLVFDEFSRQGMMLDACKVHALALKRGIIKSHQKNSPMLDFKK